MGYYIETPRPVDKTKQIIDLYGAELLPAPIKPSNVASDKAVICVVCNGMFDAAGLCFNDNEFAVFNHPDGRRKYWLLMDRDKAYELSGYH